VGAEPAADPEEGIVALVGPGVAVVVADGVALASASPVGSGVLGAAVGDADRSGAPTDPVAVGVGESAYAAVPCATPADPATAARISTDAARINPRAEPPLACT
jgi:hypothetical protein